MLVGRDATLHILDAALTKCASGEVHTVLVEGAAGCGKSELLDTFAERAARGGALVMQAVGKATERGRPLGVLRQLLASAWQDTPAGPTAAGPTAVEDKASPAAAVHAFGAVLRAPAGAPVVACVDDLHHVDDATLRCLARILREARSSALLLVLTAPLRGDVQNPDFRTELLRRGNVARIAVERLTHEQTAAVLADRGQAVRDEELVTLLHSRSGGNPLLLRALAEDHVDALRHGTAVPAQRPQSGAAHLELPADGLFVQATETCLRRSGGSALEVARALGVLAADAAATNDDDLARIMDLPVADVALDLARADDAGIVAHRRFSHPALGAALVGRMRPAERGRLRLRAAEVLHGGGSPNSRVARLLTAARQDGAALPDAAWVTDVLREAAEELLDADDPRQAAALLETAYAAQSCPRRRAEIRTRLAAVTWRFSPSAAEQQLAEPLDMVRAGALVPERLEQLVAALTLQGRVAEAAEVREHITTSLGEEYAGALEGTVRPRPDGSPDDEVTRCQRFLQSTALEEATLLPLVRAVRTLVHSEQPERAAAWCRRRLEEATSCDAPTWRAVFLTLHAEALLRLGDLAGAREHALRALEFLPQRSGSAFAGSPISALVRADTAMGRHTAAAAHLELPVPDRLFRSVHGLSYLRARGLHRLATGRLRAALTDFLKAGRLAGEWGMDRPAVLPWRGDAAEVLLRLGEQQQAEKLILEQLATPDARRSWVRGTSLRLRAATRPAAQRPALLQQAVEELRKSGDRVELARALADLGQTFQEAGDAVRAGSFSRHAWSLAESCGAEPLRERILPGAWSEVPPADPAPRTPAAPETEGRLSESERRVATFAARGYTNRQIARELYITVSTVEQHLTRVYRKLSITRRQDLPVNLQLTSRKIA